MKRILKPTIWLALLIYLFVGSGIAEGFVLCFETNGRIQIEPSHSGDLGFSTSWPSHPVAPLKSMPDVLTNKKHDSPCVDVPISLGNLECDNILFKNLNKLSVSFDVASTSGQVISQNNKLWEPFFPLPSLQNQTPLDLLDTIILLI